MDVCLLPVLFAVR